MKFYKILSIAAIFATVASSSFAQFIDVTPETYDKIVNLKAQLIMELNFGVELVAPRY